MKRGQIQKITIKKVNFATQIETFEWLHVWSEPRISILYDSHIDETWPDTNH